MNWCIYHYLEIVCYKQLQIYLLVFLVCSELVGTINFKYNYYISSYEVDKIKKYIEQTNDTTSNLRDANDINIVLKNMKKIKTRDDRIEKLEYDLNDVNDTIYELKDKVSKLEETLNYFNAINIIQNNKNIDTRDDFER